MKFLSLLNVFLLFVEEKKKVFSVDFPITF